MVSSKKTTLPDGDFFFIFDDRNEGATLSGRNLYDPDPKETEAIKARRAAYYRTFEPNWEPPEISGRDPFHRRMPLTPSMAPELVHKRSAFKQPKPKRDPGDLLRFPFQDFATEGDYYRVVSPEWKAAIESVEPGVHEFFPHEVVFSDGKWPRFIFRDRQNVLCFDEGVRQPLSQQLARFNGLAKRHVLIGRHWVRQEGWFNEFVSRELALLLLPLTPVQMSFIPLGLKD